MKLTPVKNPITVDATEEFEGVKLVDVVKNKDSSSASNGLSIPTKNFLAEAESDRSRSSMLRKANGTELCAW